MVATARTPGRNGVTIHLRAGAWSPGRPPRVALATPPTRPAAPACTRAHARSRSMVFTVNTSRSTSVPPAAGSTPLGSTSCASSTRSSTRSSRARPRPRAGARSSGSSTRATRRTRRYVFLERGRRRAARPARRLRALPPRGRPGLDAARRGASPAGCREPPAGRSSPTTRSPTRASSTSRSSRRRSTSRSCPSR